ncbi:MAG TPA: DUF937 domain-containing protein [Rudaea sp.]|jgi:hypothetical protein|nr:DUF937 domain-containing protein [Rudaea sp.]
MSGLVDTVLSHLDDTQVSAIATRLGVDPTQARTAIDNAVPLIVGHLAQNASTPQGADALNNALGEHAGFHIPDVLNGILSGSNGQGVGGAILGHIFGNNQSAANQGLGQVTGLGQQNSSQLMSILAPIVMAALANHVQTQGGGLTSVLAQEAQQIQQRGGVTGGLLSAVLNHGGGNLDLSQMLGGVLGSFGRS